jgi:hypothetical protein
LAAKAVDNYCDGRLGGGGIHDGGSWWVA